MSYNWNILDGDIYVSKNGDDVTGDGSMSLPYASINKATDSGTTGNKIVIGNGLWQEARGTSVNAYTYCGDGNVIFDGSGVAYFTSIVPEYFQNLTIINYYRRNFYLRTATISSFVNFENCYVSDVTIKWSQNATNPFVAKNSFLRNIYINQYSSYLVVNFDNCIMSGFWERGDAPGFKSQIGFDKLTNTILYNLSIKCRYIVYTEIISNNIIHNTKIYDNSNVLQDSDWWSLYKSSNDLFLDPKFNSPDTGDYTLQPDSPCLFAGKNNSHIGAYDMGYNYGPNSSEFTEEGGAIFSQSDQGNGLENDIVAIETETNGIINKAWIFTTSHDEGDIESEWIDFQKILLLKVPNLFANFIYDENGVATSRVDNLSTTGDYPNAYDFEIKTSIDEAGKNTSVWKNVRWNELLTEDNSGNGNADESYDPLTSKEITARFVKVKIYMKQ